MPEQKITDAYPVFFTEPVINQAKTRKANRTCYDNQERVRILIPGDRNNQGVFIVEDKHRERWPDHYAAFKKGMKKAVEGTPVEDWAYIDRARAMEFKAMNLHTVEQIAGMAQGLINNLGPGGFDVVERAKAYVSQDPMNVEGLKAIEERDQLLAENEKLKAQINEAAKANKPAAKKAAKKSAGLPGVG